MSGNTGKMTKEAIRQRGPRMALSRVHVGDRIALVIHKEHSSPIDKDSGWYSVLAKSYSLTYLKKIAQSNKVSP